ncbi:hypothetical protein NLJ89_g2610 [Agrocybe chaxingu]|uniref:nicotinamidase n=1 Tax=Agrocybe chaxingu TaxID=84603 RepID=A0A9W8K415_9AGAR|nr:hypothetical protein NLJ89_g2610 [Agrocybe chaxingu]
MAQPQSDGNGKVPALIIIDMQNDFVSGSLPVPDGASIINTINSLSALPAFRLKIATRDFHPPDHVSFAETHGKPTFSTLTIFHPDDTEKENGKEQVLWPVHCVVHTTGVEFVPGLETSQLDAVIDKGTHPGVESYSAFRDIWGRGVTRLPNLLKENHVTDVYFVGLAGDYCVRYSAIDSLDFGFRTWVIKDATKSIKDEAAVFEELEKLGIRCITSEEVKKLFA